MLTLSPTAIREAAESAHHYKFYIDREKKTTKSMERGTLIHLALLQPEEFFKEYECIEEVNNFSADELKELCINYGLAKSGTKKELADRIRTKDPEFKTYDELKESSTKKVLSPSEWEKITRLQEVFKPTMSGKSMPFCQVEKFHEVELEGVKIRLKADAYWKDGSIAFDLKTVQKCSERYIQRKIVDEKWYLLAAIYCDALGAIYNCKFENFVWICVQENVFGIKEHLSNPSMLERGRREYKKLIKEIKKCHEENEFPLYGKDPIVQTLPDWLYDSEIDDGDEYGI